MTKYKSHRIIDGKPKLVIVDENGNVVNKNPCKDELKSLGEENFKQKRDKKYTDDELLDLLNDFYQENGRIPVRRDFENNPGYPGFSIYTSRFGSWNNALKKVGMDVDKKARRNKIYEDVELLNYLKEFYQENGKIPAAHDFANNPIYPCIYTYQERFGSWNNALKLVGLDVDASVKKGLVQNNDQKARLSELYVKEIFQGGSLDLSGGNKNSPIDGICPKGQIYDVKSSGLLNDSYFIYIFKNKEKETIEYYFLLGFNVDYTELLYVWRVPGEIIETCQLRIGTNSGKFNVGNMIEYEITDKFEKVVEKSKKIIKENKNK